VVAAVLATAGPGFAASKKEKECGYQADIVAAVQQARLNRVKERKVPEVVMAGEVTWPERYNVTIPIFAGEMYKLKVRDLKDTNQGEEWLKLCLAN
jgi:hypothetical protein